MITINDIIDICKELKSSPVNFKSSWVLQWEVCAVSCSTVVWCGSQEGLVLQALLSVVSCPPQVGSLSPSSLFIDVLLSSSLLSLCLSLHSISSCAELTVLFDASFDFLVCFSWMTPTVLSVLVWQRDIKSFLQVEKCFPPSWDNSLLSLDKHDVGQWGDLVLTTKTWV